jgi:ankyrin repeat protein
MTTPRKAETLAIGLMATLSLLAAGALVVMPHVTPPAAPTGTPNTERTLSKDGAGQYLRDAARIGDTELISALVEVGAPIESADDKGYTPLILAAYHGHPEAVELLLAKGADACRPDVRGNTAMMGAAFKGYEDIVTRLARERCSIDQTNESGKTALMFASLVGKTGIVKFLEGRGADADRRDRSGKTAEDWAQTQRPN